MKIGDDSHHMVPDYFNPTPAGFMGYVAAVAKHLETMPKGSEFLDLEGAPEIDVVPIVWYGTTYGFLVLSEIDGKSWDYCSAIIDTEVHPDGAV